MIRTLFVAAVVYLGLALPAHAVTEMPSREALTRPQPPAAFRAPRLPSSQAVALPAFVEKAAAPIEEHPGGRLRVATVRALQKAAALEQWTPMPQGFVTRLDASSEGAEGLRVKLDVGGLTQTLEVRVQGADGRIELMTVEPGRSPEAWTPWTDGSWQTIELFSRAPQPVAVDAILHFTLSPFAKAAGTCTVPTLCTTNDPALDAAILQRKKSVMKINFVSGGSGFVCTATLLNTERFPTAYVLTANHCINDATTANSVTSLWFFENTTCDVTSAANPAQVQVAGGMQFVFGNHNVDSTLMIMSLSPPAGSVYSGFNAGRLAAGSPVTSLSHPAGDTSRFALGAVNAAPQNELRLQGRPQDMYAVRFTRGIIQAGSSGSGLFTFSSGSLALRGILSGTTVRQPGGMSCTNTNEDALYGRFEIFHAQIDQFIRNTSVSSDDAPNRVADMPASDPGGADAPLDSRDGALIALNSRRIDYAGDVDVYRFVLAAPRVVSTWTEGPNLDTVGTILDSRGVVLGSNPNFAADDDAEVSHNHFGITRYLEPGTYYVQVAHFDAAGTGSYNLRIRADEAEQTNRTSLWWNAAESGWGLNVNHQGNKIFATLFTYDANGPMWLVMSDGTRQEDGTYSGPLYRTTGPAFNATPFSGVSVSEVGTMRLAFSGPNSAAVAYTVNGTSVSKSLTKQEFGTLPACTWSAFDRSHNTENFQDLWYNPSEPGWGLNVAHQANTVFATLFTYDTSGRALWLVMSNGALNASAGNFSGPLYRTSGPVFNANPWVAATATQAGTMTFTPTSGNKATLSYTFNNVTVTKQVERQIFGNVRPQCD